MGIDILEALKAIQKVRHLTDAQMAEMLGYKNRTGWARIKVGIVPANEVFKMRAVRAFPELAPAPSERGGLKAIFDKIILRVRKSV